MACAATAGIGSPAWAQDSIALGGIVIESANRVPTEEAKVGASVDVITERDLESRSQTYVKDYLETLPGVHFTQSGPPGSPSGIRIRGGEGKYVKVLIDGMDVSDPSGVETATQLEHMLVGDVARIEVLKGPQSTLYGGEAVSGVINIQTKAARTLGFSHSGSTEYGAYNTFRGAYTAGYRAADGSNIAFTAQGVTSDGFSAAAAGHEDDGYRNLTFSGRGEYYLTPSAKVFFAARSFRARIEYDDNYPFPSFIVNDSAAYGKYQQNAGRVGTEFKLLDGAFTNTFAIQGTTIEREYFETYGDSSYKGDRVKGEYKGVLRFNERVSLLAGADWEQTGAEKSATPNTRTTADMTSVYSQLMLEPLPGMNITAGGRIDDHSEFGSFNTHRITGAYLIPGTETKVHGSIGTAFRAPSLDELFGAYSFTAFYSNPDLRPEESKGWEAGIQQGFEKGKYKIGATYFHMNTDNLIAFAGACTALEPCMINIPGVTRREGVELTAAAKITSRFTLTGGYTWTDTERGDTGARIARVPRHMFVVGFDWKPIDRVETNLVAKYVADTIDGGQKLDDFVLVNAKVSYEFRPGWKAYVRGENLLNEKYQTVLNYNTPGLSVFGGIQFSLPAN